MPRGVRPGRPWALGNNRGGSPESAGNAPIPAGSARRARCAAALVALALFAACGDRPEPVPEAPPYLDPGFVETGSWRMHYALTLARDLPSAIAGSYGIEQRCNLAVLTVTLARRDAMGSAALLAPAVAAESVRLTGERDALALARHHEAGGATWLATVEVRHRVPLTIEIRARATPESPELRARLTREFRLE
jgi:Domain of unknown function (DUF4426)